MVAAPLRNALTPGPYGGASSQQLAAASMEWVVGFSPLNENDHSTLLWFSRLLSQLFDAPPLESPAGVSNGGGGGTDNAGGEQALVYVECVPDLQTFLRLADMFIRRFIKFCKCLPEFSALHQDDQIRLLKVRTSFALEHRCCYSHPPPLVFFCTTYERVVVMLSYEYSSPRALSACLRRPLCSLTNYYRVTLNFNYSILFQSSPNMRY